MGLAGGLAKMTVTANPAGETAFGLGNRFCLGVANVHLGERSSPSRWIEGCYRDLTLHQYPAGIYNVLSVIRPFQFTAAAQVLVIEPAIDRGCSFLAGKLGMDHNVRPGYAVATGKHSRQPSFEGQRISFERSPFCGFQS